MNTYTFTVRGLRPAPYYWIESGEFDSIVEDGYDLIMVVGPSFRLVASVDDWLDYGMPDLEGDVDVMTLRTSRMARA